jgi:Zn-dependent M28 family amino/carboxypeptidase
MNKLNSHRLTKAVLLLSVLAVLVGCSSKVPNVQEDFNGENALAHVQAQISYGPRPPGSEAHRLTGEFIHDTLEANGWKVSEQKFPFGSIEGSNIYGAAGPEGGRWIILGAHYDTRPIADRDTTSPNLPVLGANDGASGVAVLLELSRILIPSTLNVHVWLTFFDAEDSGGIDEKLWAFGATKFAENLEAYPDAVVIVDMVGDSDLNLYFERNSDPVLSAEIWDVAQANGFPGFIPEEKYTIIDDHLPFVRLGIPAIDIIDFDYPYWHTTEDTFDKVSAESLEQVGRTIQIWLMDHQPLADSNE